MNKKNFLIAFILLSFGCSEMPKPETPVHTKPQVNWSDSARIAKERLDKIIYYYQQQMNFRILRDSCEIAYIRTGKDKYRIRGNRYVDSINKYRLLLKEIYKELPNE